MQDQIIYRLIKTFIIFLGVLPKKMLLFISDCLGLIWYQLDRRHREIAVENIRLAYPDRYTDGAARRFIKKNFKHTAGILFEVIWSYSMRKEKLFQSFQIEGFRHLRKAMEKGKGVLCLTCHTGNFELMVVAIAKTKIDPYVLYRKLDFTPMEFLVRDMRQRFGTKMVPIRKATDKIAGALQENRVVATLLDQNVDWYKGVFANFFGRPACTNSGFSKLVLKTRAPVVPVFTMKKKEKHILRFYPEIPLHVTGDRIKDIEINTQNYVSAVEKMVRECPEQYFWVHNRWKTKPYCLLTRHPGPAGQTA